VFIGVKKGKFCPREQHHRYVYKNQKNGKKIREGRYIIAVFTKQNPNKFLPN
jgi:hypothetical protein